MEIFIRLSSQAKPDEDFHDIPAYARTLEEHEKQYAASTLGRTGARKTAAAAAAGLKKLNTNRQSGKHELSITVVKSSVETPQDLSPVDATSASSLVMSERIVQ